MLLSFCRALYAVMLSPEVGRTSKAPMFVSLVFKVGPALPCSAQISFAFRSHCIRSRSFHTIPESSIVCCAATLLCCSI